MTHVKIEPKLKLPFFWSAQHNYILADMRQVGGSDALKYWHLISKGDKREKVDGENAVIAEAKRLSKLGYRVVLLIRDARQAPYGSGAHEQNQNLLYLRTSFNMALGSYYTSDVGFEPTNITNYSWEQIVRWVIADMNVMRLDYIEICKQFFHVIDVTLHISGVALKPAKASGDIYIYTPEYGNDNVGFVNPDFLWFSKEGSIIRKHIKGNVTGMKFTRRGYELTGIWRDAWSQGDAQGRLRMSPCYVPGQLPHSKCRFGAILQPWELCKINLLIDGNFWQEIELDPFPLLREPSIK